MDELGCETIFHAAHRAGLTTAACCWPLVEGGNDVVDYLVPELFGLSECNGNPLQVLHDRGVSEAVIDIMMETFAKYEPNLIMCHPGHLNITRAICPNVFLADAGYIKTDEEGNLVSWDAFAFNSGLSSQVYLSRPDDEKLVAEVGDLLRKMASEGIYGFERVYTVDEVKERYGLYGDFSFVLETDGFTSFHDDWKRPIVRPLDPTDYRYGHSTHGHAPEKEPQPTLIAMGPSIKPGIAIPNGSILDHAATFAKILGVEFQAQGTAAAFVK